MLFQLWFNKQQLELILDVVYQLSLYSDTDATTQEVIKQIMDKIEKAIEEQ